MHGAHGDGELIDGGGVDLGEGDGHGVVTGLDDTGNVGSGLAGLDGDGIVVVGVAQLSLEEGGAAGAGGLSVDTVIGDVVAVLSNDGSPEVLAVASSASSKPQLPACAATESSAVA